MTLTQINKAGLDEIALDHVFTIGASGSSAYTFQGEGLNGTVSNPTLYLTRGKTYRFENGSGGHPIRIQSTSGASGTAYNTGVTNNAGSGTVIVEVQHDAPDVLYYQCTSHAAMNGILYITGALADGGVTTAKIADDAVNNDKLANSVVASIAANTAKVSNATHTGDVTGSTTLTIADQAVTLDKLPHGTSSNDGKFLRANNGADPSFETVTSTTITGNADNRLITGTDTANTIHAESNATFTGTKLNLGPYDGGTDVNFSLRNTNSGGYGAYISGGSGTNYVLRLDDKDQNNVFRFNANGKLGIGTGAPIGQLHINQSSNDPYIYIQRGSGDTTATIGGIFWRNSTNNLGLIDVQSGDIDAGRMRFYVNKNGTLTESLKIDEHGNLEVLDASEARLQIKTPSNGIIALRADGGNTQLGTWSDHDLKIVRNSSIKASITANGLCFNSDTASDNALDDYEEGTWTPQVHDGTISYADAYYTKIGRQVTVLARIYNFSNNSANDGVRIQNLPFAATINNTAVGSVMYSYGGQQHATTLYMNSSNNGQLMIYGGVSGSYSSLRHNELNVSSGSTDMYICATYFTSS